MMYQVNTEKHGINGIMQIIDILNDSGLYDCEKYPWHAKMINQQCTRLMTICYMGLSKKRRVDLIVGLSRIPITPIKQVINQLLESFSEDEFSMFIGALLLETKMFETLVIIIYYR